MSDLDPQIQGDEREALLALGDRLTRSRPVPAPGFRGELRRRIVAAPVVPSRLRLRIAACLVAGAALLGVATLGVVGAGPLQPHPVADGASVASTTVSH